MHALNAILIIFGIVAVIVVGMVLWDRIEPVFNFLGIAGLVLLWIGVGVGGVLLIINAIRYDDIGLGIIGAVLVLVFLLFLYLFLISKH